jgi:hypothetical protein
LALLWKYLRFVVDIVELPSLHCGITLALLWNYLGFVVEGAEPAAPYILRVGAN